MTKKNVSKNTKLLYKRNKRNKRNTHRNTHSNKRNHIRRNTRIKKYNIQTQNAGDREVSKPVDTDYSKEQLIHIDKNIISEVITKITEMMQIDTKSRQKTTNMSSNETKELGKLIAADRQKFNDFVDTLYIDQDSKSKLKSGFRIGRSKFINDLQSLLGAPPPQHPHQHPPSLSAAPPPLLSATQNLMPSLRASHNLMHPPLLRAVPPPSLLRTDPLLLRADQRTVQYPLSADPPPSLPEEVKLTHVWYRNWPDHGAPNVEEFKTFIDKLYENIYDTQKNVYDFNNDDTIIIHCSAGVGRTGTVLIILQLIKLQETYANLAHNDSSIIDDKFILLKIREARRYRMTLVQSLEQFIFICNFFNINSAVIRKYVDMKSYVKTAIQIYNSKYTQDTINSYEFNPEDFLDKPEDFLDNRENFIISKKQVYQSTTTDAQQQKNIQYNRYGNISPFNSNRVKLISEENDYINASHMQAALNIRGKTINIILAQGPKGEIGKANTVQHFLQMCIEQRVRLIIMLTDLTEGGRHKCADYMESAEGGVDDGGMARANAIGVINGGSLTEINKQIPNKKTVLSTKYTLKKEDDTLYFSTCTKASEPFIIDTAPIRSGIEHLSVAPRTGFRPSNNLVSSSNKKGNPFFNNN